MATYSAGIGDEEEEGSISFTLTDPKLLDCSFCFQALTIPVYQCVNGHIVCSTCRGKTRPSNNYRSCARLSGNRRCRAIEKILESVKVSCRNAKYGCKESFGYSMKHKHEKLCPFVQCSSPIPDCSFEGSWAKLCSHFGIEDKNSAISFHYNRPVSVTLGVDQKFLILREERFGSLFILNNKVETLGNAVTLNRIGLNMMERCYWYELTARDEADRKNVLRFQSIIKCTRKRVDDSPASSGFLLVPSQFSCISRQLEIDLLFPISIP